MFGFDGIEAALSPYLLRVKICVAVVALLAIAGTGLYIRHAFNDRARLQAENGSLENKLAVQRAATEAVTAQFNQYIQLNRDIADAIKKVKVSSATYIDSVEASAPPVVSDGERVVLIPGGLPKAADLPSLPKYANRSAARTAAGAPAR